MHTTATLFRRSWGIISVILLLALSTLYGESFAQSPEATTETITQEQLVHKVVNGTFVIQREQVQVTITREPTPDISGADDRPWHVKAGFESKIGSILQEELKHGKKNCTENMTFDNCPPLEKNAKGLPIVNVSILLGVGDLRQQQLVDFLIQSNQTVKSNSQVLGSISADVEANFLPELEARDEVQYIYSSNYIITLAVLESRQITGVEQIKNRLNDGSGTVIGIIDTGLDIVSNSYDPIRHTAMPRHGDLDDLDDRSTTNDLKLIRIMDLLHQDTSGNNPDDCNGHGTQVTGVASGTGNVNSAYSGYAPQSQINIYKATWNCTLRLDPNAIVNAIEQAIIDDVDVLNLSLGGTMAGYDNGSDRISVMADRVYDAGIAVISTVGNNNTHVTFPGLAHKVLGVGATSQNNLDARMYYSGQGGTSDDRIKPDLMAPVDTEHGRIGGFVSTTLGNNNYASTLSGTSYAAPQVAGAIADLIEKYDKSGIDLEPGRLYAMMLSQALGTANTGGLRMDNEIGAGILNMRYNTMETHHNSLNFHGSGGSSTQGINVPRGAEKLVMAVWWPQDAEEIHDKVTLQIRDRSGNILRSAHEHSVAQRLIIDNPNTGNNAYTFNIHFPTPKKDHIDQDIYYSYTFTMPNNPPTARTQTGSVTIGSSTEIVVTGNDRDRDIVSFYVSSPLPSGVTITPASGANNYLPYEDDTSARFTYNAGLLATPGQHSFEITPWDGMNTGSPALVTVTHSSLIETITSLVEDFLDLIGWTNVGNTLWFISVPHLQIPSITESNTVLSSSNCDDECILELNSDLDTTEPLEISFKRFVDRTIDRNEGLYIQYSTDGTDWINLATYTDNNNEDTDSWISESLILDIPEDTASFRLLAISDRANEIVEIDDLSIDKHTDTAPVISPIRDQDLRHTEVRIVRVTATDAQNDPIILSLVNPPSFASISGNIIRLNPSSFDVGTHTITVRATANSLSDTESFRVRIVEPPPQRDTTPPVITPPPDRTFEATGTITDITDTQLGTATARDNRDPNPTITHNSPGSFGLGAHTITWTATDTSGNSASATQRITIQDTVIPEIALIGDRTILIEQGSTYEEQSATCTDNIDGSLSVTQQGTVDTRTVGEYEITYSCMDNSGNSASISRTITILAKAFGVPTDLKITDILHLGNTTYRASLTWTEPSTTNPGYNISVLHPDNTNLELSEFGFRIVSDVGNTIQSYNMDGARDESNDFAHVSFHNIQGITIHNNTTYVLSWEGNVIQYSDGTVSEFLPDSPLRSGASGIAIHDGVMWITAIGGFTLDADSLDEQYMLSYDIITGNHLQTLTPHVDNTDASGLTIIDGMLYVTDSRLNRVFVYDTNGSYHQDLAFDLIRDNTSPTGITYEHSTNIIWIADSMMDKVYAYTPNGTHVPSLSFDLDPGLYLGITTTSTTISDTLYVPAGTNTISYYYDSDAETYATHTIRSATDTETSIAVSRGDSIITDIVPSSFGISGAKNLRDNIMISLDWTNPPIAANPGYNVTVEPSIELSQFGFLLPVADSSGGNVLSYDMSGARDESGDFAHELANDVQGIAIYNDMAYIPMWGASIDRYRLDGTIEQDLRYEQPGPSRVSGIVIHDDKIWITTSEPRILSYDLTAKNLIDTITPHTDNTSLHGLTELDGKLYAVDPDSDRVFVYGMNGTYHQELSFDLAPENSYALGITSDNTTGTLWVLDNRSDRVFAYDTIGAHLTEFDFDLEPADYRGIATTPTTTSDTLMAQDGATYYYSNNDGYVTHTVQSLYNDTTAPLTIATHGHRVAYLAAPVDFKIITYSQYSAVVSWSLPQDTTGILAYEIFVDRGTEFPPPDTRGRDYSTKVAASETVGILRNLEPGTEYIITIRSLGSEDTMPQRESVPVSLIFTTITYED